MDMRLGRAHHHANAILSDDLVCQRLQMRGVETMIQLGTSVDDASVNRRTDRNGPRPVLGSQRQLQGTQMHVGHRNEALLLQQSSSSMLVLETYGTQQNTMLQVEFLAIRQDRCGPRVEPAIFGDVKIEREPVG